MVVKILKSIFQFIIFSNIFIALCAVVMAVHTTNYFSLTHNNYYYYFLFFATLTSYSLHWMLTQESELIYHQRKLWFSKFKRIYVIFLCLSAPPALYYFFLIKEHFIPVAFCGFLSFLYTAPKINLPVFHLLRKIAVGKTVFLTGVWTYASTILPIILNDTLWNTQIILFILIKFFLIYAICIVFDWRDRELDSKTGITTLSNTFNLRQMQNYIWLNVSIGIILSVCTYYFYSDLKLFIFNILSFGILIIAIRYAKHSSNDMLYYFILDGLMAFSSVLYLIF